jgi:polysaccharide biosynthesis protein PslH
MKILWVKTDFLHPTTRGGQIRTLEMLRRLARWHEIHYVAFQGDEDTEGLDRSGEYCARAYPIPHRIPDMYTVKFAVEAAANLFSSLPLAVSRYRSRRMRQFIEELTTAQHFDAQVCDFITPGVNIANPDRWVVFQHNVETMIWRRHAETARDPVRRRYFGMQARRMQDYEGRLCRRARHVVAVSETDAESLRSMFGLPLVSSIATGVDVEHFAAPAACQPVADLVFIGSMDWLANIDGMTWFVREVLPLIRQRRPECTVAIVGRNPVSSIRNMMAEDPGIHVTGTVPDVRPHLWGSTVSIVPLRVGSGTRLKIYEAMAAGLPVVSTRIGAEGLPVTNGDDALLADTAQEFANGCLDLLGDAGVRERMAGRALELVSSRFSWDSVAREFEGILSASG